jgi:16S rRNA processing protein RimM
MLNKKDFFKIGIVQKPHGIKGEVILNFDAEIADEMEGQDTVFIDIYGGLVPFFISHYRFKSDKAAIVLFELARTEEELKEIIGRPVFLNKQTQAVVFDAYEETIDVTGFKLFDEDNVGIGTILNIIENPDNPLLEVEPSPVISGKTYPDNFLVPLNDDLIIEIHAKEKWLKMHLPEGLLDV